MSHANIPRSRRFSLDTTVSSIREFGFGANFDPMTLFKDGKQGVWYDLSDKSTLFQDVAGTVPVTKDGDPVALMRDKSGNGNHATQSVSTSRPTYQTDGVLHWLEFDGVDDYLRNSTLEMIQPIEANIALNINVGLTAVKNILNGSESADRLILWFSSGNTYGIYAGRDATSSINVEKGNNDVITATFKGDNSAIKTLYSEEYNLRTSVDSLKGLTVGASDLNDKNVGMKFYGLIYTSNIEKSLSIKTRSYLTSKAGAEF